jgi:hypothetical protein
VPWRGQLRLVASAFRMLRDRGTRLVVMGSAVIQICGIAWAQEPPARPDSVPTDTLPPKSAVPPGHGGLLFAMAAFTVVSAVAPSAFTTLTTADTTRQLGSPTKDHVSAYLTVGGSWIEGQTWAYSGSVEVLKRGWYAEMRVETFHLPRHFQYQSFSGGYLFRPKRGAAGGVTFGYRRASRDPAQRGVMIGFPLIVDGTDGTLRLEPTYVFSPSGVDWNYRFLAELAIGDSPFSWGLSVDAKALPLERRSKLFTSALALMLGGRL